MVGDSAAVTVSALPTDPDGEPGADFSFSWQCEALAASPSASSSSSACLDSSGRALGDLGSSSSLSLQLLGGAGTGANYTLRVTAQKGFRQVSAVGWLVVKAKSVAPVIALEQLASAKVNPSAKLTLRATVTSPASPPSPLNLTWSVVAPAARRKDGATPFLAPADVATPLSSASLVIAEGALAALAGETLVLRLDAKDAANRTASADVAVPVADVPKGTSGRRKGDLSVSPRTGSGLSTQFRVVASGWTAAAEEDLPLMYSFFYQIVGSTGPKARALWLLAQ